MKKVIFILFSVFVLLIFPHCKNNEMIVVNYDEEKSLSGLYAWLGENIDTIKTLTKQDWMRSWYTMVDSVKLDSQDASSYDADYMYTFLNKYTFRKKERKEIFYVKDDTIVVGEYEFEGNNLDIAIDTIIRWSYVARFDYKDKANNSGIDFNYYVEALMGSDSVLLDEGWDASQEWWDTFAVSLSNPQNGDLVEERGDITDWKKLKTALRSYSKEDDIEGEIEFENKSYNCVFNFGIVRQDEQTGQGLWSINITLTHL